MPRCTWYQLTYSLAVALLGAWASELASADEPGLADGSGRVVNEKAFMSGPGIAVGGTAPAFKLLDSQGQARTLAELLEKGPVALVFYRSADW